MKIGRYEVEEPGADEVSVDTIDEPLFIFFHY